jgi:glutathione peroxidase
MKYSTLSLLFAVVFLLLFNNVSNSKNEDSKMSVYDFKVKNIDGREVSLSDYKGKVVLIVNVASQCGFTPQYKGLQEIYTKYNKMGFEVLAFPCNQFGGQEPGSNAEIKSFCDINYKTTFPIFDKIEVNGTNTNPLYAYLKKNGKGFIGDEIKWNFTKFLISKDGKVIDRYASNTKPESISSDIEKALK